jgi:hypothetical protein
MERNVEARLACCFQSQWDDDLRQTHYALCSDGVVLECADIPYPHHVNNLGGVNGKWVATDLKAEDLREMFFIGFYNKPEISA